ncbi:30S ribosome-binding factor RbfA [Thermonema rossianum]|jgi:ribosome-binding factor A|uniref:30S ribosome-binding factor RbfA n=1 Tax=Thermonema rossianum TaxID=55505 RepID=UPI00068E505A|nr:30S ribosome-binding factor RbfA [Thermonema rossianum]
MNTRRQRRVAHLIQEEIANIFQSDTKGVLPKALITVTHAEVTADLSIAKIYLSIYATQDKQSVLADIQEQAKWIRHQLALRIGKQIRIMPELRFLLDDTLEQAEKIEKLLKDIEIPPEDKDYGLDAYKKLDDLDGPDEEE